MAAIVAATAAAAASSGLRDSLVSD